MIIDKMVEQKDQIKETSIDRLNIRLKELEIRRSDLARGIDESDQTIHQWYKRGKIPDRQIFRVAEFLRCSPDWLRKGEFPGNIKLKDRVMNLSMEAIKIGEFYDKCPDKARWAINRFIDGIKRDPKSYRDE